MGNISSCCLPTNKSLDESVNERTRILNDPTDGRFAGEDGCYVGDGCINSKESANYGTINSGSKNNEQTNAWHRILNKMIFNVIDVSTVDLPPLEQNEYVERARLYTNRINQLRQPLLLKFRLYSKIGQQQQSSGYRKLVEAGVVGSSGCDQRDNYTINGIKQEDILLIDETLDKTLDAVKKGFAVTIDDELVVQFNP